MYPDNGNPSISIFTKAQRISSIWKTSPSAQRHLLLHFSVVEMPSGSHCLSGHHQHAQDAVAGAGGVELTGTQGQAVTPG